MLLLCLVEDEVHSSIEVVLRIFGGEFFEVGETFGGFVVRFVIYGTIEVNTDNVEMERKVVKSG